MKKLGEDSMNKKIFVVADVHGCYDEMIKALNEAGFDENNDTHLLITLGDMFDRGTKSVAIFEYLYPLWEKGKAICIRGNHDDFFIRYLEGSTISPFNYLRNGTDETFADFLGRTAPFESWCVIDKDIKEPCVSDFARWLKGAVSEINENYPELLSWLKQMPYYYETRNYIFTHASIDTDAEDWHMPKTPWEDLAFDDGSFFGKEILNTDKNVIIGHFGTHHLRKMYDIKDGKDTFSSLISKNGRILAIDGTTNYSGKVNVTIIEDDLLWV